MKGHRPVRRCNVSVSKSEALASKIDRAQDPVGLRFDAMPLPGDESVEDGAYAVDARDIARQLPESIQSAAEDWEQTLVPLFSCLAPRAP